MSTDTPPIKRAIAADEAGDSGIVMMPYDESNARESIAQQLHRQVEPTPETNANDDRDPSGVVKRSNEFRTKLGPTMLESISLAGMELAKANERRSRDLYRNKFPLLISKFVRKCTDCGTEYDEDLDVCRACGSDALRDPDPEQKSDASDFFEDVNKEGQSLQELYQSLARDAGRLGGWVHIVRYEYGIADGILSEFIGGEVIQEPTELVRADAKRVKPVVDENGRIGGYWWACPIHRQAEKVRSDEYHDGHTQCHECGADLREVFWAEVDGVGNGTSSVQKVYFEDEVIDFAAFNERLSGHDWLSPVEHLWKRQAILEWMNSYAAAFFDDKNTDRYPGRLLILHTSNRNQVEKQLSQAQDEQDQDPYAQGVLYNEIPREGGSTSDQAQVIDLMQEDLIGQQQDLKDDFKSDIRNVYGQVDVQDSELEDAGGLNNEGLQLSVRNDAIATWQAELRDGPLQKLMRCLGFTDWRVTFVPPDEPEEEQTPNDVVQAAQVAEQAGISYAIEDGRFRVADTDGVVEPEGETPAPDDAGGGGPAAFGESESKPGVDIGLAREAVRNAIESIPSDDGPAASMWLQSAHEELFGPFDRPEQQAASPEFSDDEDVPEFAQELVSDAVDGGAITRPQDLTDRQGRILENVVADSLTQPQGWSIQSINQRLAAGIPSVSKDKRQVYAANAVQDVVNAAIQLGYIVGGDMDDRRFYFDGPMHETICEYCEELLKETNPHRGGDPVTMEELNDRINTMADRHYPGHDPTGGKMHISCKHRISEYREARE